MCQKWAGFLWSTWLVWGPSEHQEPICKSFGHTGRTVMYFVLFVLLIVDFVVKASNLWLFTSRERLWRHIADCLAIDTFPLAKDGIGRHRFSCFVGILGLLSSCPSGDLGSVCFAAAVVFLLLTKCVSLKWMKGNLLFWPTRSMRHGFWQFFTGGSFHDQITQWV